MEAKRRVTPSTQGSSVLEPAGSRPSALFARKDLSSGSSDGDINLDFDDMSLPTPQPRRRTRKEIELDEIRKKLAYLNWKRMENETQIREILHTSKRMEERDLLLRLSTNMNDERAMRVQKIISEEASKPLSLPEPYLNEYSCDKESQDESYLKKTQQYLDSVHMLQRKINSRAASSSSSSSRDRRHHHQGGDDGSVTSTGSQQEQQDQIDMASLKSIEEHLHQHLRVLSPGQHATRTPPPTGGGRGET